MINPVHPYRNCPEYLFRFTGRPATRALELAATSSIDAFGEDASIGVHGNALGRPEGKRVFQERLPPPTQLIDEQLFQLKRRRFSPGLRHSNAHSAVFVDEARGINSCLYW